MNLLTVSRRCGLLFYLTQSNIQTPPISFPSSSISQGSKSKRKRTLNDTKEDHQHSQTFSTQYNNLKPLKRGIESVLSDVTNVIHS
ncbi:unnamed protein product, partial [Eruca vesicaria subsp. sativa]|nr:unnamed protein product [Eruca vesicaria subsp. sativa]